MITVVDALESELVSFLLIFLLRISQYPAIHGIPDVNLKKKASVLQQQPATYITAQCPIIYQQSRRHSEMVTAVAQFQLKSGFLGALAAWIGRGA